MNDSGTGNALFVEAFERLVHALPHQPEFHDIEINGMTSRRMGHNGRAVMRVTFKKPGTYIVSAPDDNASGISGTIKVVA